MAALRRSNSAIRAEWEGYYRSTAESDRAEAEAGAAALYRLANLPVPEAHWAEDPGELKQLVSMAVGKPFKFWNWGVMVGDFANRELPQQAVRKAEEDFRGMIPGTSETIAVDHGLKYGQFDAQPFSFCDWAAQFDPLKTPADVVRYAEAIKLIAKNCAGFMPYPGAMLFCRKPSTMRLDERGRFHSVTDPAVQWHTGYAIYAVHGIQLPEWVYGPEMYAEAVLQGQNLETRQAMLQVFGYEKFLKGMKAEKVSQDDWGVLWRCPMGEARRRGEEEQLLVVEVLNSTPEPDGSFKTYFIRVAPDCRPLTRDSGWTKPQKLTPLNAIASTFGMTGEEYIDAIAGVQT